MLDKFLQNFEFRAVQKCVNLVDLFSFFTNGRAWRPGRQMPGRPRCPPAVSEEKARKRNFEKSALPLKGYEKKMLKNNYLVAKISVDTTENGPSKVE